MQLYVYLATIVLFFVRIPIDNNYQQHVTIIVDVSETSYYDMIHEHGNGLKFYLHQKRLLNNVVIS